ncbi:hypothetical protein SpAn4DRAFT_1570 [Sporomusa ovata]|uniref:Uncharacterized protein n=1 Tax=Sporomusa ovata TaxID=2378 RepID=A0A0U1KT56_9FIRM|nr:hypothetical protein SpAn4DRAFT_1570 [Sporomusa ovata]
MSKQPFFYIINAKFQAGFKGRSNWSVEISNTEQAEEA